MPAVADTMKKNKRRGTKVVALAAALVLAGGAAFAWWTAGGSGTGSAATGSVSALTVVQTSTHHGPGAGPARPDPERNVPEPEQRPRVRLVGVRVGRLGREGRGRPGGRLRRHRLRDHRVPLGDQRRGPVPTTPARGAGPQIAFVNKATNQDGCKGATVNLAYTAS